MAYTPTRMARLSRALTSILTVVALVAGGLTYTAIAAPAPAAAEPCIPGSSPTCPPGPQPTGPTDGPTGGQTTAPQAPTTTAIPGQQPTEAPSEPTPNQDGGNGMNVQTPNQPATTNPNGIFGPTQTPVPTEQPPGQQTPTTVQPPSTTAGQSTSDPADQQCRPGGVPSPSTINLDSASLDGSQSALVARAASLWNRTGLVNIGDKSGPSVRISFVNDPGMQEAGVYLPALGGASPAIKINTAKLSGNTDADVALIAHELGHALGLPDTSGGKIMDHSGPSRAFAPTDADLGALRQALAGCADLAATGGAPYGPMYGCGWLDKVCSAVGDAWSSTWEGVKDVAGVTWDAAKSAYNWASDPAKCAYNVATFVLPAMKILQIPRLTKQVLRLAQDRHSVNDYKAISMAWDNAKKLLSERVVNAPAGTSWWDRTKEAMIILVDMRQQSALLFSIASEVLGINLILDSCGLR